MSGKENYITTFAYLKIPVRSTIPPLLNRIIRRLMAHGVVPLIRILGGFLGLGFSLKGVKRFPEYMLELSDGTRLATDIYLPKNAYKRKMKCPTILIRLPYWKDTFNYLAYAYAMHGYAVVLQDIRGCAHSEGFNLYLLADRRDGLEVLRWISQRFWYNGKLAMNGGSYFGLTQLCVAFDNENLLTCISPAVCSSLNLWMYNNGLEIHSLTTAIYRILINITVNSEAPEVDILTKEMQERWLNPKKALFNDKMEKNEIIMKFSDFDHLDLEHKKAKIIENYTSKSIDFKKRNYTIYLRYLNDFLINRKIDKDTHRMLGLLEYGPEKISQPIFMIAGWQDMFFEHQLKDFLEIKEKTSGTINTHSKMIIGPWAHAEIGHPESTLFNAGIIMFYRQFVNKSWFDYWLKEDKTALPDIEKPSIKYWVMGRNVWRYDDFWPPKEVRSKELYLHSEGSANSVKGDGKLNYYSPKEELPDTYIFNPMNPVITRGGRNLGILKGAHDQKDAEKREDVLVYSSEPLTKGIEITGTIRMILYASSSTRDTDYMVKLVDVFPNGKAINILDSGIRARFRNGMEKPSLLNSDEIYQYSFELGNTSNFFRKGHRIRIEITSSNFPRFDINSNLGGKGRHGDYLKATQKIYHDNNHPSHLIVPIYSKSYNST